MLRVGVCGEVTVEVDGRRLPESLFAGRQGRLAFAYLACERHRSVKREELAELLWGEAPPSSWPASLSAVISKLRKMLTDAGLDGGQALAASFGSYRLHLPDDAEVDWERAVASTDAAEAALRAGDHAAAVAAAAEAQAIARRGFHIDDAVWVDAQRERLRELHVRATVAAAEAHLAAGERARAVTAARDAVGLDELRESSYRLLMRTLAAAGERGEALRVWERCRTLLVEELGTDPSPETEAVYLEILNEGSAPVPARPAAALPTGVVTFLLTDIVDSSGLWERDSSGMAAALERHDTLAAETVAAHGGTFLKAKLEGDATVSVFRRASEAVLAALAFGDAIAHEPWPAGVAPAVRMALHTGEALERDGDYFGPALNRAARLRALATGGQVLVSQAVAEVVRDHLPDGTVLRSLGEYQLRGLSRVEHVFEVATGDAEDDISAAAPLARPAMPVTLASAGPFVGRGNELDRLADDWSAVVAGATTAVFISGEPGVGKTRLASEAARRAYDDDGAVVLYGRCDEELGAPYQPFAEALRSLIRAVPPQRLRAVRGVEELARLVPELAQVVTNLPAPTQADPDTERYLLFDALSRLLGAVSTDAPVVLVIDDLHWAAKPTLLLLRHVLRFGETARVQIVATYRSTDLDRTHPLAAALVDLQRESGVHRLALGGLDDDDVTAYLTETGYDDERLGAALSAVTAGNPFFLIEVLRHVDETGGHWDPSTLPQGVREAVTRRLSRLPELANEALLAGAVVGSRFSVPLVESVVERDVVDALDEARRAGIIVEEPGGLFRFNHALVRQSLLAEVASVKRVRLHQKIASALEESAPIERDAHLADLARHWFECAWAGGAAKAVDYCRRAADQAMTRLAYEEAADFYDRAAQAAEIDTATDRSRERAELLIARCEALFAAGDIGSATAAVSQLRDAAAGIPTLEPWATCFAAELAILIHPETLADTEQMVVGAAAQFAQAGDDAGEAKAHTVRARCLSRLGRVADCEAALDKALTAGRRADDPRRVNAVLAGAPLAALWGPSPVARASGRCLDVVRVLRITTGSPVVEATALRCQAVLEALRGRTDAARRMLGSARRSLESLAHVYGLLETDLFAGLVELLAGEPEAAEVALRRATEGFVERGIGVESARAGALLARAMLAQGRVDEALALTVESEGLAGVDLQAAIAWRCARAEALASRGEIDDALAAARAAVDLADVTDALIDQADAHASLAVVLRAADRGDDADREARRAAELYERKGATARVDAVRAQGTAQAAPATSASVTRARVRPNLATAAVMDGPMDDAHIALWTERLTEDSLNIDHRHQLTIDRDAVIATWLSVERGERAELVSSPIASLGERHCLLRLSWRSHGGRHSLEMLQTLSTDAEGRIVRLEAFAVERLNDAIARLLELHADDELQANQRSTQYAIASRYSDGRIVWSDDAVVVDHRLASVGELRGRDAIASADAALGIQMRWHVSDIIAFDQTRNVCEVTSEGVDAEGGAVEMRLMTVNEFDVDGRLERCEWFAPDDVDAALARYDELAVERRVRPNLATAGLFGGHVTEESIEQWASVHLADDAVSIDTRMQQTHDRAGWLETLRWVTTGDVTLTNTILATLGERQCLNQQDWSTASGLHTGSILQVVGVNGNGRQNRLEVYEPPELPEAVARLVELHADNELPEAARAERYRLAGELRAMSGDVALAEFHVVATQDPLVDRAAFDDVSAAPAAAPKTRRFRVNEALAVCGEIYGPTYADQGDRVADDFVAIDRRVQLTSGRSDFLRTLRLGADAGGVMEAERLASLGERHGLIRSVWRRAGAEVPALVVTRTNGRGQLVFMEAVENEDMQEALARLIELHADDELPPEQQAARYLVAAQQRSANHRWAVDAVVRDHRPSGLGVLRGRDAIASAAGALREVGEGLRRRTVDVLGLTERCVLLEMMSTGSPADAGEVELPVLAVGEFGDDGLMRQADWYSPEQIDDAFVRFDELTAPPAKRRRWFRPNAATEGATDEVIGALGEHWALFADDRGYAVVRDGEVRERVARDELHVAIARLGELYADDEVAAARRDFFHRLAAQFRGRFTEWTDDAVLVDHRPGGLGTLVGAPAIRAAGGALRELGSGFRRAVTDLLALDDGVSLFEIVNEGRAADGGTFEIAVLSLTVAADDGRVARQEWFGTDQVDEAMARFEAIVAPPAATPLAVLGGFSLVAAADGVELRHGDRVVERFGSDALSEALGGLIDAHADAALPPERRASRHQYANWLSAVTYDWADGAVLVDHRPTGMGELVGRDVIREAGRALRELGGGLRRRVTRVLGFMENLHLLDVLSEGTTADGIHVEIPVLVLSVIDAAGKWSHSEWFAPEQEAEALARFNELVSVPAPPYLDNVASRLTAAIAAATETRDWDALARLLTSDVEFIDHRALVSAGAGGRDEMLANFKLSEELGFANVAARCLATRGDRLALHRVTYYGAGAEVELHNLTECTEAGLATRMVGFDPEDFDAANAELDALYLAGEGAPYADTWRSVMAVCDAFNRRDWATIEVLADRLELYAAYQQLMELMPDATVRIVAVPRLADGVAVHVQTITGTLENSGPVETNPGALVVQVRDGKAYCQFFAIEDLDAANARFDELVRPWAQATMPDTAAVRHRAELNDLFAKRDWISMAELVDQEIEYVDHRAIVGGLTVRGRDRAIDVARGVAGVGVTHLDMKPLATRGSRLVLHRALYAGASAEAEILQLDQFDDAGRWVFSATFDGDDEDAAFVELDARFAAGEARPFADVWTTATRLVEVYNARDWVTVRSMLPDDFVLTDHRPTTFGVIGPDDYVRALRILYEDLSEDTRTQIVAVERINARGAAAVVRIAGLTRDGGEFETGAALVGSIRDSKVSALEMFPADDRAAAIGRFDELFPMPDPALEPRYVPHNDAAQRFTQFIERFNARDWDGVAAGLAEDMFVDDRRAVIGSPMRGRSEVVAQQRLIASFGGSYRPLEVLATRGDHVVLARTVVGGTDAEVETLTVNSYVDGLATHAVVFEPADIDAAYDALDELYLAREAAPFSDIWTLTTRFMRAVNDLDAEGLKQTISPDIVMRDHRPLSLFSLSVEEFVGLITALRDVGAKSRARIIEVSRISASSLLAVATWGGTLSDGGAFQDDICVVARAANRVATSFDYYPVEDLDALAAAFDEEAASNVRRAQRYVPENAATRCVDDTAPVFMSRDWDATGQKFTEDVVFVDRRRIVGYPGVEGRAGVVDLLRTAAGVGVNEIRTETVAVRGERLCLSHVLMGDATGETALLQVSELRGDQVAYMALFDPGDFDAAYDELDARYLAGEGAPFADIWQLAMEFSRSFSTLDFGMFTRDFAEDFIVRDHRPGSMLWTMNLSEFKAVTETIPQVTDAVAVRVIDVLGIRVDAMAGVAWTEGTTESGASYEYEIVFYARMKDGLVASFELFPVEEIGTAIARVSETTAMRQVRLLLDAVIARDWTGLAKLLADDVVDQDRRSIVGGVTLNGRDALLDGWREGTPTGDFDVSVTPLATRGDELALSRLTYHGPNAEAALIDLAEFGADDRCTFHAAFDVDDLAGAMAELDARYLASLPPELADVWRTSVELMARYNARDRDGMFDVLAEDCVIDDKRVTGWGEVSPQAFVDHMRDLIDMAPDAFLYCDRVDEITSTQSMASYRTVGTVPDGGPFELGFRATGEARDGRIARLELLPEN